MLALYVGVTLQALLYLVKLFKLLLLLQILGFDVEREIARKQGALDLVELAQLIKQLLLLGFVDHVGLVVELLEAGAKPLVDL